MPLIFLLVFLFSIAIAPAAYAYSGGEGTSDNPHLISNQSDLEELANFVNDGGETTNLHFLLTNDITLSSEFTPIGGNSLDFNLNSAKQFNGTFDGGGHTISGLYVNTSSYYVGFFGVVGKGGVVKNLTIADGTVSGVRYVGGIVGYNYGTVQNCAYSGYVNCSMDGVGGIVGMNEGIVQNCTNSATVSSDDDHAGGIVGMNEGGTVQNCTNSGSVGGDAYVGGIAGGNYSSTVENCINSGKVRGDAYVGGIVGNNYNDTVQNCAWLSGTADYGVGNDENHAGVTKIDNTSNIVMTLSASIDTESLYPDGTAAITLSTSPGTPENAFSTDGAVRDVSVTLSNAEVASAKYAGDGTGTITVTGQSEGETTITVEATLHATDLSETINEATPSYLGEGEGTKLTFTFTLTVSNIALTSISIPETAEIQVGETTKLSVTYTPENATNKTVMWESSDENIATVDENGAVTGVSVGVAWITATPEDTTGGATKQTCIVTVTDRSTEQDEDDSTTKSGGSGGGCNAGTGALALLALIPLAMRKKR